MKLKSLKGKSKDPKGNGKEPWLPQEIPRKKHVIVVKLSPQEFTHAPQKS